MHTSHNRSMLTISIFYRVFRGTRLGLANLDLGEDSLAEVEVKTRSRFLESSEAEVKARSRLKIISEDITSVCEAELGFNYEEKI